MASSTKVPEIIHGHGLAVKVAVGQVVDGNHRELAGPSKRLAMKEVYQGALERQIQQYGASFIAQGTLYTDISEAGGGYDIRVRKARVKDHHNVGLKFSVEELTPLEDCVKDSGRNIGRSIGVPEELLTRHPFPGPGLGVGIEGEVDATKLAIARQIDGIFIEELRTWVRYETVGQARKELLLARPPGPAIVRAPSGHESHLPGGPPRITRSSTRLRQVATACLISSRDQRMGPIRGSTWLTAESRSSSV